MNELTLELKDQRATFTPGEMIEGHVSWRFDLPPKEIAIQLGYHTQGKGDTDRDTVRAWSFQPGEHQGREPFHLRAPLGPLSHSGHILSLIWLLEASASPGKQTAQKTITLAMPVAG